MDEVFRFVDSFKAFPPRAYAPSFNPANILESTLREQKAGERLREAFPMLRRP